jgi:hypothetical protein
VEGRVAKVTEALCRLDYTAVRPLDMSCISATSIESRRLGDRVGRLEIKQDTIESLSPEGLTE